MHGQAVLCPFQAQCARAFRAGARAGGSGGTDESLVTMHARCTMCPWPCPRNRTSVGLQAAGPETGSGRSIGGQSGGRIPSQKPVSGGRQHHCSLGRSWLVPEGCPVAWQPGLTLCRIRPSGTVARLLRGVSRTRPSSQWPFLNSPFSHTPRDASLWAGQGIRCAGAPILKYMDRSEEFGQRARTRETTIPGAETGTETEPWMSRRRALPSGNNVVKAIGFLPEERGQSAPQILSVPYEPHGPAVLAAPALPDPPGWKAGRSQLCLSGSAERSAQLLHPAGFVPGFVQGFIQGRPPGIPPGIVQDIPVYSSDVPVAFQ